MAIGMPGKNGVISGMRSSSQIIIEVNMLKAIKAGQIPFFISENKVILSAGIDGAIPPNFFRTVFNAKAQEYIY